MFRRKNISSKTYETRVHYGKQVEKCIIEQLRLHDYKIVEASEREDMFDKIDGYILNQESICPLQIKYRQTGDDILFEISFMDRASPTMVWDGRDMIGKSSTYACLSFDGNTIWLCSARDIKAKADELAKRLLSLYLKSSTTYLTDGKGELKITTDRESGRKKMLFFAKPSSFSFETIHLEDSIWNLLKQKALKSIESLFDEQVQPSEWKLPKTSVWGKK
jgi:hypothetical protein